MIQSTTSDARSSRILRSTRLSFSCLTSSRVIVRRSSSPSASKTMISSMRLMNSGLKVLRTSPSTMSLTLRAITRRLGRLEPERRLLLDEAGADVRRHDDDRVLEVHPVAEAVGEVAVLEHLQQDVEQIRVRLLDFVEQHDRVGVALHLLGELAALFVADVSRRRANQLRHRVLLHVLGHVEADERVIAAEQEVGDARGPARSCRRRSARGTRSCRPDGSGS